MAAAVGTLLGGCHRQPEAPDVPDLTARLGQEVEYQLLQAELQLAQDMRPYLVFDLAASQLLIKLKGTPVARLGIRLEGDSLAVRRFQQHYLGSQRRAFRAVALRRLHSAQGQHSDSVLSIVGKALNVDPEHLQRELPGWFELGWGDGAVLEVRVDLPEAAPDSTLTLWQRARIRLAKGGGRLLLLAGVGQQGPAARLRVRMGKRDAMALYRVAVPGAPTLMPIAP